MKKNILLTLTALFTFTLPAEIVLQEKAASGKGDFHEPFAIKTNVDGREKAFFANGGRGPYSRKTFKIDPEKYYVASVWVKAADDKPSFAYFGLIAFDASGKEIKSENVSSFPGTETELAAPAEPGDNVLKVKNAAAWKNFTYCVAAFNAKADKSDLPNRDLSSGITGIKQNKDIWEISLKKPLKKDYPAGTRIREHYKGGYIYVKYGVVPTRWTKWVSRKYKGSELRMGSTGKFVLLCNHGKTNQNMYFDEITIEEFKDK